MKVDRVDQEATRQVAEGDVADQTADQELQGLAPVERGGLQPSEGDVGVGDLEDVAPTNGPSAVPMPPSTALSAKRTERSTENT